jgi:hypothetical protein
LDGPDRFGEGNVLVRDGAAAIFAVTELVDALP